MRTLVVTLAAAAALLGISFLRVGASTARASIAVVDPLR
jgi:hypothetical protein